ncbi:MAG: ribonuclease E/G [Coprococcus sp.]|nr:ribonuclease E/G [Coprococcus sp.]
MERKVIITECIGRILTAVFEDGQAVELRYSPPRYHAPCIGEIYVGKVKRILPDISGAFIEIADHVECFYSLDEKAKPIMAPAGKEKQALCAGDELLVQVKRDAIKTKQPLVTGNLTFVGKYVVLSSGKPGQFRASSKLSAKKLSELISWSKQYEGADFGAIFRTNAEEVSLSVLENEIARLAEKYHTVAAYGVMRTCRSLVCGVPGEAVRFLQDVNHKGLSEIVVDAVWDNGRLYREAKAFLEEEQPEDLPLLRAYTDRSYPLSKCYSLEHVTEEARKEKVWMKSGAYLVIQQTEALVVIDVNSGKCKKKTKDFCSLNQEAAREAARQIRLRNLTGIILIDFINMELKSEQEELLRFLRAELSKDSNPGKVVDMTGLQLVEITRKKIRKSLEESLHD